MILLDYDLSNLKTTDHAPVLCPEKAAWFADNEHNVLCLHENTGRLLNALSREHRIPSKVDLQELPESAVSSVRS